MSLFADLEVEDLGRVEDKVGGGSAYIDKTGYYVGTITKAYGGTSAGGAISITLEIETKDGAKITQTEWISSGTAKGCKNYYIDRNGNKQYLPGYNKIKNLDALLTGTEKAYPVVKSGNVMIYDYDAGKDLPVEKQILSDFVGKEIGFLVKKKYEDKTSKDISTGSYVPNGLMRTVYEIEHYVDSKTGRTRNEIVAGASGFKDKWLAKFDENFVSDRRDKSKHLDPSDPASYKVISESNNSDDEDIDMSDCPFN